MTRKQVKIFAMITAMLFGLALFGCAHEQIGGGDAEIFSDKNETAPTETIEMTEMTDATQEVFEEEKRNEIFQGDGFSLVYSGYLWQIQTKKSHNGEDISYLAYLDGTELICSGVSTMLGYSFSKERDIEAMHEEFYDAFARVRTEGTYTSEDMKSFEILKDDIYYTAFSWRRQENDNVISKMYIIVSEKENIVVSFVANTGELAKFGPDIPIMPILKSIVFESGGAKTPDNGPYEQKVKEMGNELNVAGYSFQSLSKTMDDNGISNKYAGEEKTIGKMIVPSLSNYFGDPEKAIVEIIEITYEDVENAWNAIDAYGMLLYNTYGFGVTYQNYNFSDYGDGYYFSELIKRIEGEDKTVYVAAIYSQKDGLIKFQFGLIGTYVFDGIGSLNLKRIAQEKIY